MLGSDEMRAWYGPDHVALAADRGAIGTLLISDELFRYFVLSCRGMIMTDINDAGPVIRSCARDM